MAKNEAKFAVGDMVVYPAHGVGKVLGISKEKISDEALQCLVIDFEKEKMCLRVPLSKAADSGLRRLSSHERMALAMSTLRESPRLKRVMWSRRAQEYESKINSGDPVLIAEVLRDLSRKTGASEQSYSERQIYQAALERLAREFAAVEEIDEKHAAQKLKEMMKAA